MKPENRNPQGWQANTRNQSEVIFHYYRLHEVKSLCKRATRRDAPVEAKPKLGHECANCAQRLYAV